ncbi:hypothetical protein [Methylomonas rapida]|uniref:Uncharacterized protein n=1 Tax=Methylomonas rapida TaxID=2963939 RepID=A0ABY7GFL1_9GAMM|nr:hypothetical protein [Methylomonas rapida]WAR44033.1 hypothetical protein NM686_016895 [Methylomonas rapida]WAR44034.1 hypothetical protein NM686_016900 [Methylomonas rapida]
MQQQPGGDALGLEQSRRAMFKPATGSAGAGRGAEGGKGRFVGLVSFVGRGWPVFSHECPSLPTATAGRDRCRDVGGYFPCTNTEAAMPWAVDKAVGPLPSLPPDRRGCNGRP